MPDSKDVKYVSIALFTNNGKTVMQFMSHVDKPDTRKELMKILNNGSILELWVSKNNSDLNKFEIDSLVFNKESVHTLKP
jgi:hypothetical protein